METENKLHFKKMRPLSVSGMLLGIGMGGLLNGILFQQIFQLHNTLSNRYFPNTVANHQLNMLWDGVFYIAAFAIVATGLALLWKLAQENVVPLLTKYLLGSMLLGFGLYNLIEGMLAHHIFEIHHVVQRAEASDQVMWDLGFLVFGAALVGVGTMLRHKALNHEKYVKQMMYKMKPSHP